MFRKQLCLIAAASIFLAFMAACTPSPQNSRVIAPTVTQQQVAETLTVRPTEIVVVPTPTEKETSVFETESPDVCTYTSNPCECLGRRYEYNKELGELKEEYIGSWHAAPFVGSAYNERFVFFPSGNYLLLPISI